MIILIKEKICTDIIQKICCVPYAELKGFLWQTNQNVF